MYFQKVLLQTYSKKKFKIQKTEKLFYFFLKFKNILSLMMENINFNNYIVHIKKFEIKFFKDVIVNH